MAEAATTSAPDPFYAPSRPDPSGAARARTEELYAKHGSLVLGLCRALLRDRAEAEDAAQQTFLSAHRALVNGSAPREAAAWLATIARNECWARIRARMRQPLPTAEVDHEADSDSDPVDEAIRRADLAALWSAIAELPVQQREALLLREFGGLSYEELAGALAVTTPAVESLLFRARQGLRVRLQPVYAAVSGAGWLEWAARMLAGSSAPAAAKVAAVGMSAAVVTGGAVVTPRVLHSSKPHHPAVPPAQTAPPRRSAGPAVPTPVLVAQTVPESVVRSVAPPVSKPAAPRQAGHAGRDASASGDEGGDHHGGAAGNDSKRAAGGDSSQAARGADDSSDEGHGSRGEAASTSKHRGSDEQPTATTASSHDEESRPGGDGGGDASSSGHSGSGRSDSGDGHSGDRHSGGGGGQGDLPANPPVTVTVPVDAPPNPLPGVDD